MATGQLVEQVKVEVLPSEVRAQLLSEETSMFFNIAKFEHAHRVATMFAGSDMVPDQFKNKAGNCMIALNYAARIGADPFMMMQSMHVIHGKPGIEGKLVAALINQSGKYSEPLRYEWLDEKDEPASRPSVVGNSKKDDRGCRAVTVDARSGKPVVGPKITWEIVHAEGWFGKKGSKWATMAELMFMYRAASWFANVHCPDVKLGMATIEEVRDYIDVSPKATASDLTDKLKEAQGGDADGTETKDTPNAESANLGQATEPPATFRDEWINKQTAGYSTFVFKNKDRFGTASEEDVKEATAKWEKLYPDNPWPLAVVESSGEEQDVACPPGGLNEGDIMKVSWCLVSCGKFLLCDAAKEAALDAGIWEPS